MNVYILQKGTMTMYLLLYVDNFIISNNNLEFLENINGKLMNLKW